MDELSIKEKEGFEDLMIHMIKALEQIRQLKPNTGSIICPKCGNNLNYSRAGSNGHVWGRCKTVGCLSWME